MKRKPPPKVSSDSPEDVDREAALDEALAESSPASDPAAMIGPGRSEVLHQEDDA